MGATCLPTAPSRSRRACRNRRISSARPMPTCPGATSFEEDLRLLAEGKPLLYQQLHCSSGDATSWMEIHKIPLYDTHGKPVALFGMVNEIGQRKELEQTFRQQQLLQRRLLDAIPIRSGWKTTRGC